MASEHHHYWTFSHIVNPLYDGTAMISADAVMVCHGCGAWKVEPRA